MDYKKKNGKYVFNKEGVKFALTEEQVTDMRETLQKVEQEFKKFACVVNCTIDGDSETMPTCVWDDGDVFACVHADKGIEKDKCEYWVAI